jgi:hypothetical protein
MKIKWLFVVPLVTGALGFAGGVFAEKKAKEIAVTPAADVKFMPIDPNDKEGKGPQISLVFGDLKKKGPVGVLLKTMPGFRPGPHSHTSDDYVIGITGLTHNYLPGGDEGKPLGPGGFWFQPGKMDHDNHCEDKGGPCMSFVYMPNGWDFIPAKAAAEPKAKK